MTDAWNFVIQGLGRREREAHPQHRLDVLNGEAIIQGSQQQSRIKAQRLASAYASNLHSSNVYMPASLLIGLCMLSRHCMG